MVLIVDSSSDYSNSWKGVFLLCTQCYHKPNVNRLHCKLIANNYDYLKIKSLFCYSHSFIYISNEFMNRRKHLKDMHRFSKPFDARDYTEKVNSLAKSSHSLSVLLHFNQKNQYFNFALVS